MTSTTQRSWRDRVREADPDWETDEDRKRPVVYTFTNGRKFRDKADPYSTP